MLDNRADGIVVLTGGTDRISDALAIARHRPRQAAFDHGRQSGHHDNGYRARSVSYNKLLACCVDLDYSALNTYGNAVQARRWAVAHGFQSLIVVTSAYHMPRALAELAHQLPDAALIPFPVVSDRLRIEPWWSSGDTAKLVLSEYLKYLAAKVRMRFDGFDTSELSTGAFRRA